MPEGPELHLASLFVNKVCAGLLFGGKVEKSEVSKNAEVPFDCPEYTISAVSRGKEVKLLLTPVSDKSEGASVVFRFGMSGRFKFTSKDEIPKHAHLRFYTKHVPRKVLSFVDTRRFGSWEYNGPWQAERGPCVMMEYEKFRENVLSNLSDKAFDKPICEAMLNQKYFNGIGNYLRAEILFRLKIPPFLQARVALETLKHPNQNNDLTLSKKIKIKKENPDLLQLCNLVPLEVIDLGGKGYDPGDAEDFTAFQKWLQCYFVPEMKCLRDSNGRTIWFQGEPGPLAPKGKKQGVQRKSFYNSAKKEDKDLKKPIKLEKTASKRKADNVKATAVKKGRKEEIKVEPKEEAVANKRETGKKNKIATEVGKTKKKSEKTQRVQKVKKASEETEGQLTRRSSRRISTMSTPSSKGKSTVQQPEDVVTPKPRRRRPRSDMSLQPRNSPKPRLRTQRQSAVDSKL